MKLFIHICIAFFLFSCVATEKVAADKHNNNTYLIKRIKTKNNWYIIYAEKQDSMIKIIAGKEITLNINCKEIEVGKSYLFELKSRRESAPEIRGVKLIPLNYLDVACFSYDKDTEICIEPKKGIYDLYYTDNLKGLCYSR